jgi:hypothetical protein
VGNDGEQIVADSSTSTGLRYQGSMAAGRNFFINGGTDIWQRGTSIALTTSAYTSDRWQGYRAVAGSTVSRQVTGDTTNLPFIQKCVRLARDSANTSTVAIQYIQTIESVNSIPYAGKAITLSFYARAGANYSPTSSALLVYLQTGTGTDQNYINGFTGATNIVNGSTATLTTTWQRFTFTATVGATATQLAVALNMNPTGTAGANDYCEVTGWQIDVGSVALPFRTYAATIQGELAACQRYYYRATVTTFNQPFAMGQCYNTTSAYGIVPFPVTMRTLPTALEQSGSAADYKLTTSAFGGSTTTTVPTFNAATQNASTVVFTASAVFTAGHATSLVSSGSGAYLGWSAEL